MVKPRFSLHVSLGLCACVTDYLSFFFLLIDCEMFNKHTHIYTQDNKTDLACTVLQNVVNIAACTHKFPIIYIYTHAVHCTIVIENCGPVTLMGKRGVVHFFFLRRQLRFSFFFVSYVVGEKNFCASGSKLFYCRNSTERTHIPCGNEKKSTKFIVCLASLCVEIRIKTKNCEK